MQSLFFYGIRSGRVDIFRTVIGEDGLELIGVSVAVKGTSIGVITDLDGKFRLNNIPPKSTVVFSYVGFENKEVKVTESKERETIVLKQSISSLMK